ncbi:MAG: Tm-1-like ATP-binding domain-containing protein [Planctomycetes bacterium]|nr:Tm-1-like ATP-binding domain-containing protein [Planctomycetota bacterium]
MAVLLIGTLDTKGTEIAFVRDRLRRSGIASIVMDAGVIGTPAFAADISREAVFTAAGTSLAEQQKLADRGTAIKHAAIGAAKLAAKLERENKITGVLGLGGSAGTTIGSAAMRALPYGIPKLLVSTLTSGQVAHFVGERDIMMLHSVVDLCGLNRFSRRILTNAANAMIGMVATFGGKPVEATDKPLIAATMFGVTTPCVDRARQLMETGGFEVLVFHATGTGGRTMEAMIRDDLITGVLDLTTTELADELVGGILSAGKDRLTAAAMRKVPQVISVGALDMVNFGPRETVPEKFKNRLFYQHNQNVTLMRTTPEENDVLGQEIAQKACAARGPTVILLPLKGVSAIDKEGGPFWWPEADQALFQSIRNWIGPWVKVIELDMHINDPAFAEMAANALLKLILV